MGVLSLRGVISTIGALCVALVAAVTLGVTLSSSLAALRGIGQRHALSLVEQVQIEARTKFDLPQDAVETMQNITRSRDWAWPSDNSSVFDAYLQSHYHAYVASKFKLNTLMTYFADNTFQLSAVLSEPDGSRRSPPSFFELSYSRATSITAAGGDPSQQTLLPPVQRAYSSTDFTELPSSDARWSAMITQNVSQKFVGNSFWRNDVALAARGGRRGLSVGVYATEYNGIVQNYIPFVGSLFRRSDPPDFDHIYGFTVAVIDFDDLEDFLHGARATPNTQAFAADRNGYMMGTTMATPFSVATRVAPGSLTPTGCATTESVPGQTQVFRVCRTHASDYGYGPLSVLLANRALAYATTGAVDIVEADGDVFFVASAPVPLRFGGVGIQLWLFMPQADVIGDVVASRNTAIGITCAVFVVAAVAIFVLISVLLAPLTTVADRMAAAANMLDDEPEPMAPSAMAEVRDLQDAFEAMDEELRRIRSFVPQSVLAAKRATDMDDLDLSTELHTTDTGSVLPGGGSRRGSQQLPHQQATDSRSVSSRHSRRSAQHDGSSKRSASAVIGFSADCGLHPTTVAVIVANARGFSSKLAVGTHQPADGIAAAAELVSLVSGAVRDNGGVLGAFHGDQFSATFNAVCPCSAPARRAATAAFTIASAQPNGLTMRCGLASGRCSVGNLGTDSVKVHSTIGAPFMQAIALERLTKRYGPECKVLSTHRTLSDVATAFLFQFVDIVRLPGRGGAPPTPIGTLVQAASTHTEADAGGMGEWLYVLGDNEGGDDPRCTVNRAVLALSQGDLAGWRATSAELLDTLAKARATESHAADEPARVSADMCEATERRLSDALRRAEEEEAQLGAPNDRPPSGAEGTTKAPKGLVVASHLGEYYGLAFNCGAQRAQRKR